MRFKPFPIIFEVDCTDQSTYMSLMLLWLPYQSKFQILCSFMLSMIQAINLKLLLYIFVTLTYHPIKSSAIIEIRSESSGVNLKTLLTSEAIKINFKNTIHVTCFIVILQAKTTITIYEATNTSSNIS